MTIPANAIEITPHPALRKKIEELSGVNLSLCFQCEKCTNGCPVSFAMDIQPHRVMRLLHLGQVDRVLRSKTIWTCASCETCTTRCPNGIDTARVMDTMRQLSGRQNFDTPRQSTPVLHSVFLSSIKRHGRVHETEMTVGYALKSEGWPGLKKLLGTGLAMFFRGKIVIIPHHVRSLKAVREIFRKAEEKAI
jgi:heterodisulfide reductase subunit C